MSKSIPITEEELEEAIAFTTDGISTLEAELEKINYDRQIQLEFGTSLESERITKEAHSVISQLNEKEAVLSEQLNSLIEQLHLLRPTDPLWVPNLAGNGDHYSRVIDPYNVPPKREALVKRMSQLRRLARMHDDKELEK